MAEKLNISELKQVLFAGKSVKNFNKDLADPASKLGIGSAAAEAADFGAEAAETACNGITAWSYAAEEESDGATYTTNPYMFENGDYFAEIVFWLDGRNARFTHITDTGSGLFCGFFR